MLDSVGIGALPDAGVYGDQGSDTLGNIARQVPLALPTLRSLGLGLVAAIGAAPEDGTRTGAYGRMAEASAGKDSVTGHWEMMGIVLDRPFPVFPHGFAPDIIDEFSRLTGRGVIGNVAASGTQIIDDLGPEHMRTGALIVYTSADSVFQIAAHEDVVPIPELYRACEVAYKLVGEGLGVGRVIARPFVGRTRLVQTHGESTRLRAAAVRRNAAGSVTAAGRRRSSRSERFTICSPDAASDGRFTPPTTQRAWTT